MNNKTQQVKIRPLQKKDNNAVENICIITAPEFFVNTENRRKITLLLYCDYYTRMREHSFVAVNEKDEAVGYIFCEPDNKRYKNEFKKVELKKLLKLGIISCIRGINEIKSAQLYADKYPGHMHIDILPQYQRQGIGHMLLDTLTEHLKNIGSKGFHLGCGTGNEKGISFYRKYGFKELGRKGGSVLFGIYIK